MVGKRKESTEKSTNEKASRGPIPTLAPGQVLSQKEPKISSMARQKQVHQNTASKAPRKAPVGGKTVMKAKKRRSKPGIVALRQIKRYQKTTELLIPHAPFVCLIKEIMVDLKSPYRIQATAVSALQEAAETTLVKGFEMTQVAAIHTKRVTIQQKDMKLVQSMRLYMTGFQFPGQLL
ncbi:hypothetical protein VC83_02067 [Pseudogymnoascus destructans]|uniref:Core Histone H2A/H2B/H3 domain-containing protein n=1 Tax=Pseudogymnoascus destructans TaxID=655981 RepID=A0A177AH18_9PEZI|nr:uncharacterized protein VC83_02067 [Pseudogymnoascus destructans]OAF61386.1 hypothetical protein VC83_02067 [Pseudogymnoascus destructans]